MDSAEWNVRTGESAAQGPKGGISGSTVKIIAVAAMLIDHIGAVVLERQMIAYGLLDLNAAGYRSAESWLAEHGTLYWGYMAMRLIGRLGFPIFCFLLVEGFQRTRDVKKYALRLGIFALVSELPFNLAISGQLLSPGYQNVFFTLLIGLLALCSYRFFEKYEKAGEEGDLPGVLRTALTVTGVISVAGGLLICLPIQNGNGGTALGILGAAAVVLIIYGRKKGLRRVQTVCADMTVLGLFMILAEFMCTDYAGMGVLTISAMYVFRKRKVLSVLAGCAVLTVMSVSEITAFFVLIPIAMYNGRRGLRMKYFFYGFYPVHLFLLYLAAVLLGLGNVAMP